MTYSAKAREIANGLRGVFVEQTNITVLTEQIERALTLIGNEREAIGYEKGKHDAKKELKNALVAIAEGADVRGEDDRFIVVKNDDEDPTRGDDVNFVIDLWEVYPALPLQPKGK